MAGTKTKKAPSKSTSTSKAPAKPAAKSSTQTPAAAHGSATPTVAAPVTVNNQTRRSDEDGIEGGWVEVVSGPHKGVRGSFLSVTEYDKKSGYPKTILVQERDFASDKGVVSVDYGDCRPALDYHGGR